ncbi:hypothetical protein CHS0354_005254 [Potamilus streckersoni]|uniref:Uncharacterized protein n=1 Tax=Potamilus streckersoni TaxID=2493646 RepID=A0AAE0S3T7_9BIVA|nr:hypothetical protein CHS0354_005254 [Potamilus streckersoni]
MRQELDSRTQDKDLVLLGCLLNHTLNDLEFPRDSERAYGYALLLKVALGMAAVKVNVKVEPETSDKQPSDILPPLPIVSAMLNIRDDNDKTVVAPSLPSKKAKVNVDMDDWLQDVVCLDESQQPITDVIHKEVSRYLVAVQSDTSLTMLQCWK